MVVENFKLKWNDFESNLADSLRDMREEGEFFDVTLACDDNQISAHKVVLSACSPLFKNILKRNHHEHPLIYLRGIQAADLEAVVGFMYDGEINVAQTELAEFLALAQDLSIQGLSQVNPTNPTVSDSSHLRDPSNCSVLSKPHPEHRLFIRTRTPFHFNEDPKRNNIDNLEVSSNKKIKLESNLNQNIHDEGCDRQLVKDDLIPSILGEVLGGNMVDEYDSADSEDRLEPGEFDPESRLNNLSEDGFQTNFSGEEKYLDPDISKEGCYS